MDDPQLSHRSSIGTLANIGLCLIVIALGAVVIGGWYLNNTTLIQINPNFAPMQFNTALCFLLSGIGLAFFSFRKVYLSLSSGVLVGLIGLLTFLTYIFSFDLGFNVLLRIIGTLIRFD